ncbi:Innexin [Aphelenchoides fujianensis]|nr:Innexin [Aphelenchoides fujianensis]
MVLTTVLSMVHYVTGGDDRDVVNRLNAYFTTNLLVGLAILVSFKQFGGAPIECIIPDTFSGPWEQARFFYFLQSRTLFRFQYAESLCFAQDTYVVPDAVVVDGMPREQREEIDLLLPVGALFFFLFQAACFRLPNLFFTSFSDYSGIKLRQLVQMASDEQNVKGDIKKSNGALQFHRRLLQRKVEPHRVASCLNLPYHAFFVTLVFLTTKFLILANVILQLWLMNKFLQTDARPLYGWGAITDLLQGHSWEQTLIFPRVTMCDFTIRVMGNLQQHSIQCVLLINLLNEKIFILLWFWFVSCRKVERMMGLFRYAFLLCLSICSFSYYFAIIVSPWDNRRFITRHLEMGEERFDHRDHTHDIDLFMRRYLQKDGVFVVRVVSIQAGVMFATELLQELWLSYKSIEDQLTQLSDEGNNSMAQYDRAQSENKKNQVRQRKGRKSKGRDDPNASDRSDENDRFDAAARHRFARNLNQSANSLPKNAVPPFYRKMVDESTETDGKKDESKV